MLSNTIADNEHKLKVEARDKLATLELAHNDHYSKIYTTWRFALAQYKLILMLYLKPYQPMDIDAWQKQLESLDSDITLYDEQVKVSKTNLDTAREQLNAKRGRLETLSSQVKRRNKKSYFDV